MNLKQYPFPEGCKIIDIRPGKGPRACFIYAKLIDKDENVLIAATLEYINESIRSRGIMTEQVNENE